ncbi:MAG: MBL fold metallo-hydrolase [Acidobacteria bacterium]|nr:MBL fold metallo-hydrolase [Acidobacteriota bacterium]
MRKLALLLVAAGLVAPPRALAQDSVFNIEELASGVYVALQPTAGRFNDSNSVIILTEQEVIVVDSQANADAVGEIVRWIDEASRGPLRFLINTHWHSDHTQGNDIYRRVYPKDLTIIGHESLVEDVPKRAGAHLEEQIEALTQALPEAEAQLESGLGADGGEMSEEARARLRIGIERARLRLERYRTTRLLPPDLTYRDRMVLRRPGRTLELRHVRAHTRGDTVIYLPEDRILITGDVLDDLPYGGHGYPGDWIRTLEELESLDFEIQVPGHGRVRHGKAHLRLVLRMFRSLAEQTRSAAKGGKSLEETQAAVDLGEFRTLLAGDDATAQRAFDAWMPETIARAYAEATGQPLDQEP